MRWLLATLAHAQLVVDWTARSTFKARCAPYTTVTFHRTCLPNANPRSYRKPKDCRPLVRFDEIAADFGLGPAEDKAMNNWRPRGGHGRPRGGTAPGLDALYELLATSSSHQGGARRAATWRRR